MTEPRLRSPAIAASPEPPAWPSGDCLSVVVLTSEPPALAERWGIDFFAGADDLDVFTAAVVTGAHGRPFLLMRHTHAPSSGTVVYADAEAVRADARAVLAEFLRTVPVPVAEVSWTTPFAT